MIELLVVAVCLLLNAIFSCIEMAFVTVSKPHLKQLAARGSSSAQRVFQLKENPERTLSVLQIGITLVGAASAAVGGAGAQEFLSPWIQAQYETTKETSEAIAIVMMVLPLTYLSVVLGELVPKSLALRNPLRLALAGGILLQFMDKIFSPIVFILEKSTKVIMLFFKKRNRTTEELEEITAVDIEPLSDSHKQYVLNLIDVDHKRVRDIMVPWVDVVTVERDAHYREVLEVIKTSRHTRIPIVSEGEVIGILHSKEFISESEIAKIDWHQLMRPMTKVKSSESILTALKSMQAHKSHIALVTKEGQRYGVVTIEDIFEEFVGDIFEDADASTALLSSNAKIRSFNTTLNRS